MPLSYKQPKQHWTWTIYSKFEQWSLWISIIKSLTCKWQNDIVSDDATNELCKKRKIKEMILSAMEADIFACNSNAVNEQRCFFCSSIINNKNHIKSTFYFYILKLFIFFIFLLASVILYDKCIHNCAINKTVISHFIGKMYATT